MAKESRRMHYKLFLTIGKKLPTSSRNFDQFITAAKSLLEERDTVENQVSAEKLLNVLESRGYISIGNYTLLKQILEDADLGGIHTIVATQEEAIKRQLELEKRVAESQNPVRNVPNPPSHTGNTNSDSRPYMTYGYGNPI